MTTKTHSTIAERPVGGTRLKYQQVKDYLIQQIADGHLKSGDVLPPEKVLAKRLGKAVHTVRHALSELSSENIVRRVHGTGTIINVERRSNNRQTLDVFALVLPELNQDLYPSLIKGFLEAAAGAHHQVLTCDTHLNTDVQGNMILQLIDKNVAGVGIVPAVGPMPAFQFNMLRTSGIPVVFCHRRPPGLAAPLVTWDPNDVGCEAIRAILAHGHRRVGFVARRNYTISNGYQEGMRDALVREGLDMPDGHVLYDMELLAPPADDSVRHALTEMFSSADRPTAIFCSGANVAERVMVEASRLGLRVPDDLSVVTFGCIWQNGAISGRQATVGVDERELGRQTVRLLEEMRAGERPMDDQECVFMPLRVCEGQTLGPAPKQVRTARRDSAL
jgi:GntR family transcriptional regulator, arabinose operon transcriptional repressor